ncbi:MAG: DUF424 family protein [Thermoplasmata archaeon]
MIIAKLHKAGSEAILAACDPDLSGKVLEDGDIRLDMGSSFFGRDEVTEDEFRGMLAVATSANIVGERAVKIAIDMKCVHPDAVARISGIPYAMFFCMG